MFAENRLVVGGGAAPLPSILKCALEPRMGKNAWILNAD